MLTEVACRKEVVVLVVAVGNVTAATVNVAVAVVLLSVIVSVAFVDPAVSTAVAVVFEVIVAVPRLAPVPPLSLNRLLVV
jgi:hypothetical protein